MGGDGGDGDFPSLPAIAAQLVRHGRRRKVLGDKGPPMEILSATENTKERR
jgi:hypothetical protein